MHTEQSGVCPPYTVEAATNCPSHDVTHLKGQIIQKYNNNNCHCGALKITKSTIKVSYLSVCNDSVHHTKL